MSRIALKLAYDGTGFHGHARQPGLSTVEGEILVALTRANVIQDDRASRFESASRTDRGVSALGNVVAFDTNMPASGALRAFNGKARGVWAWAVASVPKGFRARQARERWYRYALSQDHEPVGLHETLSLFRGEHDFRNFTKDRDRSVARIDVAAATREDDSVVLDFIAPSFRWNLIRRLVAAALQVESGTRTRLDVRRALERSGRIDLGLAPAEPLTLMDVAYDVDFHAVVDRTTLDRVRRLLDDRMRSTRFAEALLTRLPPTYRERPNV